MKILLFASHPIQYQVPIYRELSKVIDLRVIYLHHQTPKAQAKSGFGVEFEWDIPLTDGYNFQYLKNISTQPSTSTYNGIILDKNEIKQLFVTERPSLVIVHGWFPKGFKQIINYCYQHHIKIVCRGESTLIMKTSFVKRIIKEFYIRNIFKKINAFLYIGNENKKYYLHYGVKETQLYPSLYCINTPFFKKKFDALTKKDNAKLKDTIHIGFAGKFIPLKQPFLLLKAISLSKYKNNIEAVFIGDGPLKQEIKKFAKQHNIKIKLTGFLNQSKIVKQGYGLLDIFVLPSYTETWGLVVNEVMTGGIPSIVSDKVGCNTNLIVPDKTGYVFRNKDVTDLKNKIDDLITKIKSGKFKQENVINHIEKYSLNNTVKDYVKAVNELIK